MNKSKAIREFKSAHPKAGPTETSRALLRKGIKVTPVYVSTVLSNASKASGRKRRGRAKAARGGDQFSVSALVKAKKFAEEMGGIAQAKAAIDAVAKLL
ncbi:MAG: hypothetical protein OEM15_04355 [Myxococcales bacterium]|nr:hypothetical protein [Myxococcales bacterium]MDH3484068.1 hypothetical protein [Myxococcales bacterium]